ncbi:hypothetical protein MPLSOD_140540 [Mesorhizobium sp. SOD10]|nr:hypothetical protein MPLSOD_140540 [Mesorhizobium sp. SOD10]
MTMTSQATGMKESPLSGRPAGCWSIDAMPGRCPSPERFHGKRVTAFPQELQKPEPAIPGKARNRSNRDCMETKIPGSRQPRGAEVKHSQPEAAGLCTSFERITSFGPGFCCHQRQKPRQCHYGLAFAFGSTR